ncbi:MAG: hypothetical protein L6R40_007668 [Gallowayella cf. fulva]|nr:MAG: hypothetical protein L6R40_007668 [Xanthomendoza cf. fulva]
MRNRKAPKTLAEEVADLEDPAPKDLDPEQPDVGDSSDGDSGEDTARATGHYLEVSKGKIRKPIPSLGPEYSGSHISRDDFFDPEGGSDDDPFASAPSEQSGSSDAGDTGEFVDPDDIDPDLEEHVDEDEEIDSDEAFGEDDEANYHGFTFRGSKSAQGRLDEDSEAAGYLGTEVLDEDRSSISELGSDKTDIAQAPDGTVGYSIDQTKSEPDSGDNMDEDPDVEMEDKSSISSEAEELSSEALGSSTDESSTPPPADNDRAALRKIMADSQELITSNLSKAAESDVAKGQAIKEQRRAFDSLLNTRIRLQKAMVATNSLPSLGPTSSKSADPAVEAAETAALKLWSTMDSLRHSLQHKSSSKFVPPMPIQAGSGTPLSTLWTHMQAREHHIRPHRLSTFNKWASKTAPTSSLPRANKFSSTPTQQPLSAVLEQQLTSTANMEKLVAKTRIPRSCAPLQAAAATASSKHSESTDLLPDIESTLIYDDADFYSLLLRDLLDQRSSDPNPNNSSIPSLVPSTMPGIKDPALRIQKKRVDTKASKGRKIRYTVQEKVQNFMAPDERGKWGERQRDELFKGLLGKRVMREDDEMMDESEDERKAEDGLRLFR